MYLLCLDESGPSHILKRVQYEESNFFVLAGIIIEEKNYHDIINKFDEFKKNLLPSLLQDKPLHAVELHNLKYNSASEYKAFFTPLQARDILKKAYEFISKLDIEAIAIVIDNHELSKKYPFPENPYLLAYRLMLEKFQKIIEKRNNENNLLGSINISRSHQDIAKRIDKIHREILLEGSRYVKDYKNILPKVCIIPTKEFPLFEIADLVCYAYSRSYRDWICEKKKMKTSLESDYIEIIRGICTTKIGKVLINKNINVKVFPNLREFEDDKKET